MFFFPAGAYYADSQSQWLDSMTKQVSRFFKKIRKDPRFALYTLGLVFTTAALILLLILMASSASPNTVRNVYLVKLELSNLNPKEYIMPAVSNITESGLSPYYTLGITGYCTETDCKSYSPFYYSIIRILQDNLYIGRSAKVPEMLLQLDPKIRTMGQVCWVFCIMSVIIVGVGFLVALSAWSYDDICLVTAILMTTGGLFVGVASALSTVTAMIYGKAFAASIEDYPVIPSIGKLGFGMLYASGCCCGIATACWWMLVRRNNKNDRIEDIERQDRLNRQRQVQPFNEPAMRHMSVATPPPHPPQPPSQLTSHQLAPASSIASSAATTQQPLTATTGSMRKATPVIIHNGKNSTNLLQARRASTSDVSRHVDNAALRTPPPPSPSPSTPIPTSTGAHRPRLNRLGLVPTERFDNNQGVIVTTTELRPDDSSTKS